MATSWKAERDGDKQMKSYLKWIIPLLVMIAVAGYFANQYFAEKEKEKQVANTEIAEVSRQNLKSIVSATGTIRPVDYVEVSPKTTARIKEVLVKENDHVTAGQTVAILDAEDIEEQRNQAAYKVENAKIKHDRDEYLYSIGAKPKSEYDDSEYNYQDAQSKLKQQEKTLSDMIITAPMDGVVVGEPKTAGTMAVQGNTSTVIMTIADLSKKQILAKVDETDIGSVKAGQSATFTVDSYTNKTFTAKVSKISQSDVNSIWNTRSSNSTASSSSSVIYYYVVLDVDDPENLLLPAMTARVEIITEEKQNAVSVPMTALKADSEGTYVMRALPEGKSEKVYVQVGIYSNDYAEITGGLNEGDKLVVSYKAAESSGKKNGRSGPPPM